MRNLLEFLKRYNYVVVFLLLEIAGLLMLSSSSYYQNSRITRWANGVAGKWFGCVNNISGYFGLKSENEHLAAENAMLRAQMSESYIQYRDTVFTIEDTVYKQRYAYTEATVLKNTWSQMDNYLMINKGEAQGIKVDMAVISPQGIVGVVIGTTENFATIMPVLHSNSRNSVKVRRTSTNGSLVWEGGDYRYAKVLDIPTTHKLYKNDTIVTSGLANDFPEGIPVGYVESVSTIKGSGFYSVKVRLATDFNKLDHVYVVNNRFRAEQDSLMRNTVK